VIDTHAHLDALEDPAGAIARAHEAGVERIVAIGSGLVSAKATLAIAEHAEGVVAAVGIHPHQAASGESIAALRPFLEERAVAVGEIGLDFYRDYAPHDAQMRLFRDQLALAAELGKPVVIHSRAADKETAAALEGFSEPVVLHCFSSPRLLSVALDRGYFVSFAGNVTFPKAADLRDAAARVPADRLLVETDCPYLSPQPVRGRPNEPAYVVHTIRTLAEVRAEDVDTLAAEIDANAARLFSWE
jgi:TatD DNase family protein